MVLIRCVHLALCLRCANPPCAPRRNKQSYRVHTFISKAIPSLCRQITQCCPAPPYFPWCLPPPWWRFSAPLVAPWRTVGGATIHSATDVLDMFFYVVWPAKPILLSWVRVMLHWGASSFSCRLVMIERCVCATAGRKTTWACRRRQALSIVGRSTSTLTWFHNSWASSFCRYQTRECPACSVQWSGMWTRRHCSRAGSECLSRVYSKFMANKWSRDRRWFALGNHDRGYRKMCVMDGWALQEATLWCMQGGACRVFRILPRPGLPERSSSGGCF